MTPANRAIDYAVSRTFAAYFDSEPEPLYPVAHQTDGETRLWRRLDELNRHIVNLQQRINGQQTEIDKLKTTLDRMTGKPPTLARPAPIAKPPIKEEAPAPATPRRDPPIEDKGTYL